MRTVLILPFIFDIKPRFALVILYTSILLERREESGLVLDVRTCDRTQKGVLLHLGHLQQVLYGGVIPGSRIHWQDVGHTCKCRENVRGLEFTLLWSTWDNIQMSIQLYKYSIFNMASDLTCIVALWRNKEKEEECKVTWILELRGPWGLCPPNLGITRSPSAGELNHKTSHQ